MSETQLSTNTGAGFSLAPASMSEAIDFASQVAKCDILPDHLKGKPGNCLRVVMQASQWGMNFFAVADKTSVIQGKLMYEGQLTAAVVNACGRLKSRLRYDFDGEGQERTLTVSGVIRGEDEPRTIELTCQQATAINRNGQMSKNPDQQMCYIGARIWARRHMPEVMLGVYGDDEEMAPTADETPAPTERPSAPRKAKGGAAAAREMKAAEVVEDEPEPEPEPEVKKSEPKKAEAAPEPEPEAAAEEAEVIDTEEESEPERPKPPEKAKAFVEQLKPDQVLKGNFAIDEIKQGKDKAGNPLKILTVTGPYRGIAYCKDNDNQFVQEPGLVWMEIKGVGKGDKVLALVSAVQEAQAEI